jgi:hypothetical protein
VHLHENNSKWDRNQVVCQSQFRLCHIIATPMSIQSLDHKKCHAYVMNQSIGVSQDVASYLLCHISVMR